MATCYALTRTRLPSEGSVSKSSTSAPKAAHKNDSRFFPIWPPTGKSEGDSSIKRTPSPRGTIAEEEEEHSIIVCFGMRS